MSAMEIPMQMMRFIAELIQAPEKATAVIQQWNDLGSRGRRRHGPTKGDLLLDQHPIVGHLMLRQIEQIGKLSLDQFVRDLPNEYRHDGELLEKAVLLFLYRASMDFYQEAGTTLLTDVSGADALSVATTQPPSGKKRGREKGAGRKHETSTGKKSSTKKSGGKPLRFSDFVTQAGGKANAARIIRALNLSGFTESYGVSGNTYYNWKKKLATSQEDKPDKQNSGQSRQDAAGADSEIPLVPVEYDGQKLRIPKPLARSQKTIQLCTVIAGRKGETTVHADEVAKLLRTAYNKTDSQQATADLLNQEYGTVFGQTEIGKLMRQLGVPAKKRIGGRQKKSTTSPSDTTSGTHGSVSSASRTDESAESETGVLQHPTLTGAAQKQYGELAAELGAATHEMFFEKLLVNAGSYEEAADLLKQKGILTKSVSRLGLMQLMKRAEVNLA